MDRARIARMTAPIAALAVLAVLSSFVGGCGERQVRVETGRRVVCKYGETISSTIKVVEVPASEAHLYSVKTIEVTCSEHRTLETLYAAAQRAIAAGDLATARAKLAEVIALRSDYGNARAQAADIDAGRRPNVDGDPPKPGGSSPGGSTEPTDSGLPEGPIASLSVFVPDEIPGFRAERIVASEITLTRDYVPTGESPITSAVVVAEQYANAAAARAAAEETIRGQYPEHPDTLTVSGHTVLYGAAGTRFAAVGWTQDAVLVVIEGYSQKGASARLEGALTAMASAVIR